MEKEIKCHLCGQGKVILKFEEMKLDEGKITLKDSPYYACTNCKEERGAWVHLIPASLIFFGCFFITAVSAV